jgi:hypothetical protein
MASSPEPIVGPTMPPLVIVAEDDEEDEEEEDDDDDEDDDEDDAAVDDDEEEEAVATTMGCVVQERCTKQRETCSGVVAKGSQRVGDGERTS